MAETIHVLQIGGSSLALAYQIPQGVRWHYEAAGIPEAAQRSEIDVCILGEVSPGVCSDLLPGLAPYTVFYTKGFPGDSPEGEKLIRSKAAAFLDLGDVSAVQEFIRLLPKRFYRERYGQKMLLFPDPVRTGMSVNFEGHLWENMRLPQGDAFRPLVSYRESVPMEAGIPLEIWLEYAEEGPAAIELIVRKFRAGATDQLLRTWHLAEEEMTAPFFLDDEGESGYLCFSIRARGEGTLRIGPLHYRYAKCGAGEFLPGGEQHAADNRQEILSFFHPGDLKPPLCVYFSGYRKQEGFEGYQMMHRMGAPFLLFSDPRIEGGAFYLGTEQYERMIVDVIQEKLGYLGFSHDQLILSGISMGSVGALYYGAITRPHAVIVGKPIPNVGSVALNEQYLRPGGFPTSLDVLRMCTGGSLEEDAAALNQRIWDRIDQADWTGTEIAASYMQQDDYDPNGFADLLEHLRGRKVRLYGKGMEGRHNDNTEAVTEWFQYQYRRILREDFGRGYLR